MEAKKNLKLLSVVILALTAFSAFRVIFETFTLDFNPETLPEGTTKGAVLAAQIIILVFSFVLMLPEIYVGVRGLKVSKSPDSSRAYITWAKIITVICVIASIAYVIDLIKGERIVSNVLALFDTLTDAALFYFFVRYAKHVSGEA